MEGLAGGWQANVRLLVALNNLLTDEDESMFNFTSLPVIGGSQVFLGLPCTVKHPITTTSPLYGLTLAVCYCLCSPNSGHRHLYNCLPKCPIPTLLSYHYYQPSLWIDHCGMLLSE
jgi:hypothetical protein